jgi:hypothetical protein
VIRERRGAPVVVGDVTLTPVERVTIRSVVVGGFVLFSGSKELVSVVVQSGEEQFTLELKDSPDPEQEPGPSTP